MSTERESAIARRLGFRMELSKQQQQQQQTARLERSNARAEAALAGRAIATNAREIDAQAVII